MTQFEFSLRKIPTAAFRAGANAYSAGFHISNNPHKANPPRQQWTTGYFQAKSKQEGIAPRTFPPRSERSKRTHTPSAPVLSVNRINRFNNRFRTQVEV